MALILDYSLIFSIGQSQGIKKSQLKTMPRNCPNQSIVLKIILIKFYYKLRYFTDFAHAMKKSRFFSTRYEEITVKYQI